APVTIVVRNVDVISSSYEEIRYKPRPGHADLAYIKKYGYENWDYRGGGRSSARETLSRVAASALAKKLLMLTNTLVAGHLVSLGPLELNCNVSFKEILCSKYSPLRCSKKDFEKKFKELIKNAIAEGNSYGGTVEVVAMNPPVGLGEPVFDKIKADLAKAIMSIPAVVGFEYGLGFKAVKMKGNEVNDEIIKKGNSIGLRYNTSGGILGGITTGEPIVVRCAFKPTSSIRIPSKTVNLKTNEEDLVSTKGRHDPAVAIRGVSVVEAMVSLVLIDHAIRAGVVPSVKLSKDDSEKIEKNWRRYMNLCKQ
ncbi:MAG: chorismate synthase, partial [Thermoproteota archaeon]